MVLSSVSQVGIIALILGLGALLHLYLVETNQSVAKPDDVFAYVAGCEGVPKMLSVLLVLGIVSASFSATGSALTSLTTSFTTDILGGAKGRSESHLTRVRECVHIAMAVIIMAMLLVLERWSSDSVINIYYRFAGYTYGPLLGLFAFGLFSKRSVRDRLVPVVVILAPIISALLDHYSKQLFGGYEFGFELMLVTSALTIFGLALISRKQ